MLIRAHRSATLSRRTTMIESILYTLLHAMSAIVRDVPTIADLGPTLVPSSPGPIKGAPPSHMSYDLSLAARVYRGAPEELPPPPSPRPDLPLVAFPFFIVSSISSAPSTSATASVRTSSDPSLAVRPSVYAYHCPWRRVSPSNSYI